MGEGEWILQSMERERLVMGCHKDLLWGLFFNIYINDLFMFVTDSMICNYADDTTIYASNRKHTDIIRRLENETSNIVNCSGVTQ